jgi:hypothetical protein
MSISGLIAWRDRDVNVEIEGESELMYDTFSPTGTVVMCRVRLSRALYVSRYSWH